MVASAALSPVVMVGGWLAADALQPPSYSPVRSSVSGLSGLGGTDRWLMTSALILVGACYLVTAVGLPSVRVPARIVLLVAGLSSIGIAASPEPVRGSTPLHLAWTSLGAVAITIWPAFTARRDPSQPLILRIRGAIAVTVAFFVLLAWLVFETRDGTALGLAERLVSAVQVTWPLIVALALRRSAGPRGRPGEYRAQTNGGADSQIAPARHAFSLSLRILVNTRDSEAIVSSSVYTSPPARCSTYAALSVTISSDGFAGWATAGRTCNRHVRHGRYRGKSRRICSCHDVGAARPAGTAPAASTTNHDPGRVVPHEHAPLALPFARSARPVTISAGSAGRRSRGARARSLAVCSKPVL